MNYPYKSCSLGKNPSRFKGNNLPVEAVSWNDAIEFCTKLSDITARIYRLPSEAEWEYACRAGTTTPFHFGDIITTDLVNYNGNYTYASPPIGEYREETVDVNFESFFPNSFGLYQMHGNVWEWCLDTWHDNYQGTPSHDTSWIYQKYVNLGFAESFNNQLNNIELETQITSRLLRGGSCYNIPRLCRSAVRGRNDTNISNGNIGFRVVLSNAKGFSYTL